MTLTPEERAEHVRIAPEEVLESGRSSLVTGMVIARAWRDPDYLKRLLSHPREVLTAAGLELPPGIEVRVVKDTPTVRYITMTRWTSEPEELLPLFREMLPLPEGNEIRLIQNTEQAVYLIVPLAPKEPETLTDVDLLRRLAPRAAIWATNESLVNSVQFTEGVVDILGAAVEAELVSTTTTALAETQAVSLTNIVLGEAEAAATTTVAAEAEATAIEAEAVATTTTLAAEAEIAAVEAEAAATTTTAAAEAEVTAVEVEAAATSTTVLAEAEAVAVAAIVLT